MVYLILGTALDGVSMIVLTTSVVIPMAQQAGFDLVWFGIFIVLLAEIAEITPPLGFNLFVMQTMTGEEQTEVAWAFFLMLVLTVVLVTLFPVTLVTACRRGCWRADGVPATGGSPDRGRHHASTTAPAWVHAVLEGRLAGRPRYCHHQPEAPQ